MSLFSQVKGGQRQPPRKMQDVIPKLILSASGGLIEHLYMCVQTRPPTSHEGQYRLKFQGQDKCVFSVLLTLPTCIYIMMKQTNMFFLKNMQL